MKFHFIKANLHQLNQALKEPRADFQVTEPFEISWIFFFF